MRFVYTDYFQKSRVFLYPLLGIKKGVDYVPAETYICWDKLYDTTNYKLICVYKTEKTVDFKNFELKHLKTNSLLDIYHNLGDRQVYAFDLRPYKHDYHVFTKGQYSKFSVGAKNKILQFFGEKGNVSDYIQSFLNPSDYHKIYADSLNVDINIIEEVYEVCNKPDIVKETFYQKIPDEIQLLSNKSISLKQN